jgi:predicted O-methyltransferase YrrM
LSGTSPDDRPACADDARAAVITLAGVTERSEAEITVANREYTETWLSEDGPLTNARPRGRELGAMPIGSGGGAVLRFLAASIQAKSVVEIGTGAGVSGTWLLRGMHPDGVLTSIDLEAEHQRVAKQTFVAAGFSTSRFRLISGSALQVLPRLTDGAYDIVFGDAAKEEYSSYLDEALRLLRPGGIVAFDNALWHGRVADPGSRDPATVAVRDLLRRVRDDDRLVPVLLPSGDGLLAAVLRDTRPGPEATGE